MVRSGPARGARSAPGRSSRSAAPVVGRASWADCSPSRFRAGSVLDRDWPSSAESSSTTTIRVCSAVRTVSGGGFSFEVATVDDPDHGRRLERLLCLGVRRSGQPVVLEEVELVPGVVEQLGVDGRRTGLPRGLDDQLRHGLADVEQRGPALADQRCRLEVARVLDLGHDPRPVGAGMGQREQGLDDLGVGVVGVRAPAGSRTARCRGCSAAGRRGPSASRSGR